MPDPSKTIVRLAVKFVEYQGKRFVGESFSGEVMNAITEAAGDDAAAKLAAFFDQGDKQAQFAAAFTDADACFAAQIGDSELADAIRDLSLARLPSLEKLADALPKTLDDTALVAALRARFAEDYPHLSPAQLDRAARVYRDCLDLALATKCDQLLPTLFRKVVRIDETTSKMLPMVEDIHARVTGAPAWKRPVAPRPDPGFVGRMKELNEVRALLAPGTRAAITATVHGTPGVGKTWLARQLAAQLDSEFPGGVLFHFLGSTHRSPDQCAPILDEWGRRAGYPLARDEHLSPAELRGWLAGHGALLVVLDDIWDAAAVKPLLEAVPRDASILLTTRKLPLARETSDIVYSLDILMPDDALGLLYARMDKATDADAPLLRELAEHLGRHAQALDIASKNLNRWPKPRWKDKVAELARLVREGQAFGELPFPGEEERESNVEAALKFSYDELDKRAQTRFRTLGAFAPDASFRAEFVAALWNCPTDEALGGLTDFYERGLLSAREGERWQQHLILHSYALALLRRAKEEDGAHSSHANTFLSAMRQADKKQVYYLMLPEYSQLRHAFKWTIEHDLPMARNITAYTGDLQMQFNLVRESLGWTNQIVEKARQAGEAEVIAGSLLNLGNALGGMANLPDEDRAARLRESLAAYDEALQFYTLDTTPLDYAMTQNNRGNILKELASLPGEDRAARLHDSLAAYDEALRFRRPDTAPLDYATTQSNRGTTLSDLSNLPGEDRAARLRESLTADDAALQFYDTVTTPLDYAMTQNNRGTTLRDLANFPGEDRGARLRASLAAFDKALRFYTPDTAPLAYATTQNNRGNLLRRLATLPDEDPAGCLRAARSAYDEALRFWTADTVPLHYAATQGNLANLAIDLAELPGEDRRARWRDAIRYAYTAHTLFVHNQHETHAQKAADLLRRIAERCGEAFPELWEELELGEMPNWLK